VPETFVDFRVIKQNISITSVLGHYRVELRKVNSHSLRGRCPLPTHTSEKSADSFNVDTGKNIWACQSTSCASKRQGKKGGNIIDFVAAMEKCPVREAAITLHGWFSTPSLLAAEKTGGVAKRELVAERKKGSGEIQENTPLTFVLKNVVTTHPYLLQRGISDATAHHFGVGYFPGRGSMAGRVVIPIHNAWGDLVAYAGRSIDNAEPKYRLPAGFHKSLELFNLHHALESTRERVFVVEGFFDCMKVHQAGFPNVVALMGSSLSSEQQKLLRAFEHVILFLDDDESGREATTAIAHRLMYSHFVKAVSVTEAKQPDQMSSEELKLIVGSV